MKSLSEIIAKAKLRKQHKIVVVAAHDMPVLEAIKKAYTENLVEPLLIGDSQSIKKIGNQIEFQLNENWIVHEPDDIKAANLAVKLINEGKADILMKGLISTAPLLKAILKSETGLKDKETISHVAVFESKFYSKLLGITDAAMNIAPSILEKIDIINNAVSVFHKLEVEKPKVAVLAPIEFVNTKIESTVHASEIAKMHRDGKIPGCIIDGPLALDNAISREAAEHKGIHSEVAGDADILVVPDLNTGNALYKSMVYLGGATPASVIIGAKVPFVLTSRADSEYSKHASIALATLLDSKS
jgi:phosphate butyryltransferase